MVRTPFFMLLSNGIDITQSLKNDVKSIQFTDQRGEKSDQLVIKIANAFYQRPKFDDTLVLMLGYKKSEMFFAGTFKVQTSKRINNEVLVVTATGADFSKQIKEKKSKTFEKKSLSDIVGSVAGNHGLQTKCDFDIQVKHQLQTNESDLNFLERLSKEYNAIFSIKNGTLIFIKNNDNNSVNGALPTFLLQAQQEERIEITHTNKSQYKSATAHFHDTKEAKAKKVTCGGGNPVLKVTGSFKDEAEAKAKAEAKLAISNRGTVRGVFTGEGRAIYAGGNLILAGTPLFEDDGIYSIKTVKHTYDANGWKIECNFENIDKVDKK